MLNILLISSIISSIIPLAFTMLEINGKCPEAKSVSNFDIAAYTVGRWYEVARYQNDWEKQGDCSIVDFKTENNEVIFNITEKTNGIPSSYSGVLRFAGDTKSTITTDWKSSSFKDAEGNDDLITHFVDSDNINYVINYQCRFDKKKNVSLVTVWVLSRTKTLEGAGKAAFDNYMKTSKLVDANKLVWNHFTDKTC